MRLPALEIAGSVRLAAASTALALVIAPSGCGDDSTSGSGGATTTSSANGDTTGVTSTSSTHASASATGSGSGSGGGPPIGTPTFVVAGYQLRRLVSTDGSTWEHDVSDPPDPLDNVGDGIAFGKGIVAVVAHSGLVTSPDGATWTKIGDPLPQAWPGLGGGKIVFDGERFVIIASSDSYESTDGVSWTKYSSMAGATHWNGFQFGNGHYIAVGDSNGNGGDRKASEDGQTWHDYAEGGPAMRALAFGNGVFVAIGPGGYVQTTTDGVTWDDHTDPSLGDLNNLVFADGTFLTCGYPKCRTSTDGVSWTEHDATSPPGGSLAYGNGLYVSTTWESNILTSSNGFDWTTVFSGDPGTPPLATVGFGYIGR